MSDITRKAQKWKQNQQHWISIAFNYSLFPFLLHSQFFCILLHFMGLSYCLYHTACYPWISFYWTSRRKFHEFDSRQKLQSMAHQYYNNQSIIPLSFLLWIPYKRISMINNDIIHIDFIPLSLSSSISHSLALNLSLIFPLFLSLPLGNPLSSSLSHVHTRPNSFSCNSCFKQQVFDISGKCCRVCKA